MSLPTFSLDSVDSRIAPFLLYLVQFGILGPGLSKLRLERLELSEHVWNTNNMPPPCDAYVWNCVVESARRWADPERMNLLTNRVEEMETSQRIAKAVVAIAIAHWPSDDVHALRVSLGRFHYDVHKNGACVGPSSIDLRSAA